MDALFALWEMEVLTVQPLFWQDRPRP
jgi:hypothetical protein